MSPLLLSIVSGLYLFTGIEQAVRGNYWWAVAWVCYAIANVALIHAMKVA